MSETLSSNILDDRLGPLSFVSCYNKNVRKHRTGEVTRNEQEFISIND